MPPQLRIALWLLLAAFGGFVATASAAIDFTPVASQRTLEGAVFQQLVFRDGTRKVAYEQPRGWNVSGGGASILFTPPDVSQAQARIDQTPLQQPQTFDEATAKLLQEQALTFLPPNSQNPAVVGEERNAILIDGQATYEVTMQYLFYGEEYEMSVLFVNIGDTQLRCQVIAKKNDFPKIHTLFRGSLCSLQWL
jgi:hypothetical protein